MIAFTFDNPTARPAFATLGGLLACLLSPRYRNGFALLLDPVSTRAERTRRAGVIEVELHEDGSGLEVAAFGWLLVADVVPKQGALSAGRTREK
jgi:hypothetical protein